MDDGRTFWQASCRDDKGFSLNLGSFGLSDKYRAGWCSAALQGGQGVVHVGAGYRTKPLK